jgi:hypothetical protein
MFLWGIYMLVHSFPIPAPNTPLVSSEDAKEAMTAMHKRAMTMDEILPTDGLIPLTALGR